MRTNRAILIAAVGALLATAPEASAVPIVYSSLPLHGAARSQSLAVVRGARLAVQDSGGAVSYVSLDDSTARAGAWAPERVQRNARRALVDGIAYIGELNSGATAVSLPILKDSDVPMISPSNTAIGLTRGGPGTISGEPDKYYPTGVRTYFRLTPNDGVQGGALAVAMRNRGCRRVGVLDDRELYGHACRARGCSRATASRSRASPATCPARWRGGC